MALNKQGVNINFGQGLDTKTDPKQVQMGKMLALQNSIFTKGGLLAKRNGYAELPSLPNDSSVSLATYNGNLTAIGTKLYAFSEDSSQWINTGSIQPVRMSVLPAVRTSTSQTTVDVALGSNNLACVAYRDSTNHSFYQIIDSVTGQIVVPQTALPTTANVPRVFFVGNFFVVVFVATVSGTAHLQYIAVPIYNPASPGTATDISTQVSSVTAAFDGVLANGSLYLAWNGSDLGGAIRVTFLNSILQQGSTHVIAGQSGTRLSVVADATSTPVVWVSFWDSGTTNGYSALYSLSLGEILAPTQTITTTVIANLTSYAQNGLLTLFIDVNRDYTYVAVRDDLLQKTTVTSLGVVTGPATLLRGVGLAGKAFYLSNTGLMYVLLTYGGTFQPTYFIADENGNVIAKLAYSNGSGWNTTQILPQINVSGSTVLFGYLFKDLIVPVNKSQGVASAAGIYSQNGINLATLNISDSVMNTAEIGNNLNLAGGIMWMYDGVKPVEQNFHLWPEDVLATPSTTGGTMTAQQYFYSFVYEWTDAQGNIHRGAPSIPYGALTTTATSSVTIQVPTLRLTYKTSPNSVRIVGYRWSAGQQIYYQFTSITTPVINDPSVDFVTIVDTSPDSSILGNLILYTTGGVVENIGPPACSVFTLFKSRLFLVDAEDKNLLWYSKQVIENTPVEMSDLFTLFVAPTISAQGSTGPITALSSLDDKLIIFKKNAIYYVTGTGPDNTGNNNDFSEPVFITATVGCSNQQSIVFSPQGLIFESDKGRWLLGRDLSSTYIGSPVEMYNDAVTESAINVPGTNQVRLTLDNRVTLMYDYFYNQWGTFNNIPAISSTIYQGLHTYLNSFGQVFQETPGVYQDGGNPVLMSFTTAWIALAGLQGFERAYFFHLLGQYISPHKLNIQIAYDFDPSIQQTNLIAPINFSPAYGLDPLYGSGSPYGGPSPVEQWRVFLQRQKCQSFQITLTEVYDATFGIAPGAGLTLSGINLVVGAKGTYPRIPSAQYVG